MSHIRLNILDQTQTINGEVHASIGDAVVAALAAEPETIEELALALARFVEAQGDKSPFGRFSVGQDFEHFDAGVIVVDLSARVAAVESSYSQPSMSGEIAYHDGAKLTDIRLPYRLPDDWLIVHSITQYQNIRERRREERERFKPFDARAVLYGRALIEFIVRECMAAPDNHSVKSNLREAEEGKSYTQAYEG